MGITKTGASLKSDLGAIRSMGRAAYKTLGGFRAPFNLAYKGVKGIGRAGSSAANTIGKGVVNNPRTALIIGGGTAYAANKLPEKFTEGLSHVDPNQHYTYASPTRQQLRMVRPDPITKTYMKAQNRIF